MKEQPKIMIDLTDAATEFLADRILQRFMDAAGAAPAPTAKTRKRKAETPASK